MWLPLPACLVNHHISNFLGAVPETVYIHSEEVSDITYVVDRVRVKVKAIGALTAADVQVVHSYGHESTVSPGDSTPNDAQLESKTDLSKVCVCVCVWVCVWGPIFPSACTTWYYTSITTIIIEIWCHNLDVYFKT